MPNRSEHEVKGLTSIQATPEFDESPGKPREIFSDTLLGPGRVGPRREGSPGTCLPLRPTVGARGLHPLPNRRARGCGRQAGTPGADRSRRSRGEPSGIAESVGCRGPRLGPTRCADRSHRSAGPWPGCGCPKAPLWMPPRARPMLPVGLGMPRPARFNSCVQEVTPCHRRTGDVSRRVIRSPTEPLPGNSRCRFACCYRL
jgi:hypothetical protein